MELSIEQQIAFDKYIQGKNIFITGPGGSGKSALIRKIYSHAYNANKCIYVTALTGCAAILLNCKATTLHSWAGIGLGLGSQESIIQKIKKNKFASSIWKGTNILIVDEVSMLSRKLFDLLNAIGKVVRNNHKPFGGIQLIFSGDFYQLPPVGDKDDPETTQFCFESDDWNSVFNYDCQIEFKKIFRQSDELYASILNQIREGKIKRKSNDLLMKYVGRELSESLIVEPTKLYPTKNKVMQINTNKMNILKTEQRTFVMKQILDLEMTKQERTIRTQYSPQNIENELNYIASNLICEKEIVIKIGAQVMCIVNIKSAENDILVCNGSQGIVTGYCDITGCPRVKYNNGIELTMTRHIWTSDKIPGIGVSQVPLILAWALTIHKSQGATLDVAEIDVGSGIFECGQTYVALSRVRSLDGLYLTSFDVRRIKISKKVQDYYIALRESMIQPQEICLPLAIAEPIQQAIPIPSSELSFVEYEYEEANDVRIL
jgi:ATP-dependent DNA helicase PIF1